MNQRDRKDLRLSSQGFTLIEMAIVLIIIGIIIGAVIKGKDIVRGAEQKKLYTQFVNAWELAFVNYYERTGWILGDTATDDNSGVRDGRIANGVTASNINAQLQAVGLELPSQGSTGSTNIRRYSSSTGSQSNVTITFRNRTDDVASTYNCIELVNMPTDLGIAMDRIKDGEMDGTTGDFIAAGAVNGNRIAWPAIDPNDSGTFTVNRARLILQF
ncbi:MAG: prepilin-type N-terminal cleavage/methylation domain-containing protein [Desulfatiglans sp.]|jgi:prepilin-type N-terminal cleavage/methylation domain-containing protein|nr:prepilin-type N-terminal cleavage/methylation domain-containing protein [Thermodesulfobacteriota bacterium]MEE4353875.1 prepilin-type N-terminal cleavage/methylation domain-containing protein [Desulfatiglans sp.]